jgi:hypothetical protein
MYWLLHTCFGSSLPSSGSFLDPTELLEIPIMQELNPVYALRWETQQMVRHTTGGITATRHKGNVTTHYISPIQFVFQVTQDDLRSYLMMTGYYRNMYEPTHRIKEWYKSVHIVGLF